MSNTIFPTLAGLTWNVLKSPRWSTKVQQSVGGKEMRAQFFSTPLYTWTLTYELLRASALLELQSLLGFFNARQGRFDSFLFTDPADSNVAAHGFGIGDGTTTSYPLQRSLAGPRALDFQGMQNFSSTPRTNLSPWSEQIDQWTLNGVAVAANVDVAPDGTITADRVTPNVFGYAKSPGIAGNPFGRTFTASIWLKTPAGTRSVLIGVLTDGDVQIGVASTVTVTSQWQRFTASGVGNIVGTAFNLFVQEPSGTSVAPWLAWGGQLEESAAATPYIQTPTSGSATSIPAYWPATADAFERLLDLNGPPTIFRKDWQGNQQLYPTPRTNLSPNSEALNTGWSPRGSATVTANATTAPDGTATADQFNPFASGGFIVQSILTTNGLGRTWSASVWLKATTSAPKLVSFGLLKEGDLQMGVSATVSITQQWQRFTLTGTGNVSSTTLSSYLQEASGNSTAFYAWGFQIEEAVVAGAYIKTTAIPVTLTDYTLSATGLVTFAAAPLGVTAAGQAAILTWTGAYFWRVRFDLDQAEFNNFLSQLWEAKKITLVSVKAA